MVISDQMKVLELPLQSYPVFQRSDIVADVQLAGRPHSAQNSLFTHSLPDEVRIRLGHDTQQPAAGKQSSWFIEPRLPGENRKTLFASEIRLAEPVMQPANMHYISMKIKIHVCHPTPLRHLCQIEIWLPAFIHGFDILVDEKQIARFARCAQQFLGRPACRNTGR